MRPNLQFPKNFVRLTEEVFIRKLRFLCSVSYMTKCFTKFTRFFYWSYLFSYSYFPEFCCDAIKNAPCNQFLCKCLPEKYFADTVGLSFVGQLYSLEILKIIETRKLTHFSPMSHFYTQRKRFSDIFRGHRNVTLD